MCSQIYLLILVLTYGPWLISQPGQKHIKPGLAGHEKPKPDEATNAGPGLEYLRPEARKSQARNLAFRPSRASKSLFTIQNCCSSINCMPRRSLMLIQLFYIPV